MMHMLRSLFAYFYFWLTFTVICIRFLRSPFFSVYAVQLICNFLQNKLACIRRKAVHACRHNLPSQSLDVALKNLICWHRRHHLRHQRTFFSNQINLRCIKVFRRFGTQCLSTHLLSVLMSVKVRTFQIWAY